MRPSSPPLRTWNFSASGTKSQALMEVSNKVADIILKIKCLNIELGNYRCDRVKVDKSQDEEKRSFPVSVPSICTQKLNGVKIMITLSLKASASPLLENRPVEAVTLFCNLFKLIRFSGACSNI